MRLRQGVLGKFWGSTPNPYFMGIRTPMEYNNVTMLGGNPHTKRQLDPFSRLSTAHECDRQGRTQKFSLEGAKPWRARARAYNGGLGAEPPAGSRGRWGARGRSPPLKLKTFQTLDVEKRQQICPVLAFWELRAGTMPW